MHIIHDNSSKQEGTWNCLWRRDRLRVNKRLGSGLVRNIRNIKWRRETCKLYTEIFLVQSGPSSWTDSIFHTAVCLVSSFPNINQATIMYVFQVRVMTLVFLTVSKRKKCNKLFIFICRYTNIRLFQIHRPVASGLLYSILAWHLSPLVVNTGSLSSYSLPHLVISY